jgi:hypothetical protein
MLRTSSKYADDALVSLNKNENLYNFIPYFDKGNVDSTENYSKLNNFIRNVIKVNNEGWDVKMTTEKKKRNGEVISGKATSARFKCTVCKNELMVINLENKTIKRNSNTTKENIILHHIHVDEHKKTLGYPMPSQSVQSVQNAQSVQNSQSVQTPKRLITPSIPVIRGDVYAPRPVYRQRAPNIYITNQIDGTSSASNVISQSIDNLTNIQDSIASVLLPQLGPVTILEMNSPPEIGKLLQFAYDIFTACVNFFLVLTVFVVLYELNFSQTFSEIRKELENYIVNGVASSVWSTVFEKLQYLSYFKFSNLDDGGCKDTIKNNKFAFILLLSLYVSYDQNVVKVTEELNKKEDNIVVNAWKYIYRELFVTFGEDLIKNPAKFVFKAVLCLFFVEYFIRKSIFVLICLLFFAAFYIDLIICMFKMNRSQTPSMWSFLSAGAAIAATAGTIVASLYTGNVPVTAGAVSSAMGALASSNYVNAGSR